jgi:hypothetical protein
VTWRRGTASAVRAREVRISNLPAVQAALAERDAAHAKACRLSMISDQLGTPEADEAAREAQSRAAAAYDRHIEVWHKEAAALHSGTDIELEAAAGP